jgi:hypothetical protein
VISFENYQFDWNVLHGNIEATLLEVSDSLTVLIVGGLKDYSKSTRNDRWPEELSRYSDWLRACRSENRISEGRDFSHKYRPSLGPTQPPVRRVPGLSRA